MQKVIVYTGNFLFPDGNAAGKRVSGNVKAIIEAGYKVACICFRKDRMDESILAYEQDGVFVYTIPYAQGFKRMNNALPKKVFMKALGDLECRYTVHAVIMYGTLGTTIFNLDVIRICRKRQINIIYDMVDLFDDPFKNNYLRYIVKRIDLWILLNRVLPACDKWIAISTYLQGRMPDPEKTIIVPPLSVEVKSTMVADGNQPATIAYASLISEKGIPVSSWKDRVDAIVDVCYVLLHERSISDFKMCFIGFTRDQLLGQFPEAQKTEYQDKLRVLENHIVFYGLQSNANAQKIISQADFTILLRDSKTCTNAGFPTKVSESLSLGVPVIANATSDITMYVQDRVNGCIVPDPHDIEGIADKIEVLIALTRAQKDAMRINAVNKQSFYYANYIERFRTFFME